MGSVSPRTDTIRPRRGPRHVVVKWLSRRFMRQSRPMDPRHGNRPSQVRPRPPSTGRPSPTRVRPVTPSPARLDRYRRIERRHGLPLASKALLAASILLLGGTILWVSAVLLGPLVASTLRGLGGLVPDVATVTASPSPTAAPDLAGAPSIQAPDNPYTNRKTMDITVNVPAEVTGTDDNTIRLYDTLADQEPQLIREEPVGATSIHVLVGVTLTPGRNDLQAVIFGPGGEGERSEVATWILDRSKPKAKVISPEDNATVNRSRVTVKGKSQAGAEIRLQNAANGAIATTTAGSDGLWETRIAVANGTNLITVRATDPAGNENTAELTVIKGSGKLTAALSTSTSRFKASKLPKKITLTVTVTDPDGQRLQGAVALFTVSVPGLEAIVSAEIATDGDGVASFTTTVPPGAMPGGGLATVLVTVSGQREVSDRQVLTVVK